MGFLSDDDLRDFGFAHVGREVRISDRAAIYDAGQISIGDFSRIDDFTVVSGKVTIGRNVHIAVQCNVAGGSGGITFGDFSGLAYGCNIVAQSDDYSGESLTNPTTPEHLRHTISTHLEIGRHAIVGAGAIVLPGASLAEGTAVGAASLVLKPTEPWGIYAGTPARRVKERTRALLAMEAQYLAGN